MLTVGGDVRCGMQVGNIYQRFTSPVDDEGTVENIINFKTPASSLVFTVGARWAGAC